jgi:hypothetical protein
VGIYVKNPLPEKLSEEENIIDVKLFKLTKPIIDKRVELSSH